MKKGSDVRLLIFSSGLSLLIRLLLAAESFLSPFYTFLAGNDASRLPGFPTGPIVRWKACPKTFVDVMHIINFQAGRMFPGRPQ